MDLYKFFKPHFSPRLRRVPLRHQEIHELLLASDELRKAVRRAALRSNTRPSDKTDAEQFEQLGKSLDVITESLERICWTHPGDEPDTLKQLIEERSKCPGWETWVTLASERLEFLFSEEKRRIASSS